MRLVPFGILSKIWQFAFHPHLPGHVPGPGKRVECDSSGEELSGRCLSPAISPVASLVPGEMARGGSAMSQECLMGKRWCSWRPRKVSTESLFQAGSLFLLHSPLPAWLLWGGRQLFLDEGLRLT